MIFIGNLTLAQEPNLEWKEFDKSKSLKWYIEKQAYKDLEFNIQTKDSIAEKRLTISHEGAQSEIIIRDNLTVKRPILIINQFPIDKLDITDYIKLNDINEIYLWKPSDTLSAIYGYSAKFGLINIMMDKREWKKVKRKYGR